MYQKCILMRCQPSLSPLPSCPIQTICVMSWRIGCVSNVWKKVGRKSEVAPEKWSS